VASSKAFSLGTFSVAGSPAFAGVVVDDRVMALHALKPLAANLGQPLQGETTQDLLAHWSSNFSALQAVVTALDTAAAAALKQAAVPVAQLQTQAPWQPRNIFCASANYRKHVIDLILDQPVSVDVSVPKQERRKHAEALMDHRANKGKPFAFLKLTSCVIGPNDNVVLPFDMTQPDWELELGVVIGKTARRVPKEKALEYVAGYTIGNDLTGREMLGRPDIPALGHDWIQAKCAPTFQPLGPYIVPAAFVTNPQDLLITLKLNGQVMQNESTSDMIFPIARLIEWLSAHVELQPGDLLLTGSPSGNGTHYQRFLKHGDVMESTIAGLGMQRNLCVAEEVSEAQKQVRFEKVEKYVSNIKPAH
jgi:2-keto-4-pentenoate hydratase/2-oxohepta-3-ene-1,7-dioic acid hydratase in catechol pathway